jgi:hypothetical protein
MGIVSYFVSLGFDGKGQDGLSLSQNLFVKTACYENRYLHVRTLIMIISMIEFSSINISQKLHD